MWEVRNESLASPGFLVVPLSFLDISLPLFSGSPGCKWLYFAVHFCLFSTCAKVMFSGKEILGIVQYVWEEFDVGFGVETISSTFGSLSQRSQCDGGKSLQLGIRITGVLGWALTELLSGLGQPQWVTTHHSAGNSVCLWFQLLVFNTALWYAKIAIVGVPARLLSQAFGPLK